MSPPKKENENRGARTYLEHAVKAASHPVRREILKCLKKKPLTSVELEEETGESRYNLYHHLSVLSDACLISESQKKDGSGKAKTFELLEPARPQVGVLLFDEGDLDGNEPAREKLLDAMELLEEDKIPYRDKISAIEIHLKYDW